MAERNAPGPRPASRIESSQSASPLWLATSMLPDVEGGKPSKSTHLQRLVLAVVGLRTGRGASVTFGRLVEQWPSGCPMPHPKVLRRTLRRLVTRQVVELVGGAGYRINRQLAAAAAARGARFRYVLADFDAGLTPVEVDVLALLRGMRSARGHSAGYLAELLGRDERSVRSAIYGRQRAQEEGGQPSAGLLAKGRLAVDGETRLRRGNRVPVLVVVDGPQSAGKLAEPGNRSPGRGNSSPGRRNRSPDTLDSARPADSARLDHPPDLQLAPPQLLRSAAPSGGDDPTQLADQQDQPPAVLPMPTVAAAAADEAAGRQALASWPDWWSNLRRAVAVVQGPTSGDVQGYGAAWFDVLTLAGVLVPARVWRGTGPTTLRQRRRDLAERLAREQGHPTIGATWLYTMAQRIESSGKPPSAIAAALVASVTPKNLSDLQGSNPAGVELGQLVKPQGGDDASQLPQEWLREAMTDDDRAKADGAERLVAGRNGVQQLRDEGGEIAARKLKEKLAAAERENRLREILQRGDATQRRQIGRLVGAAEARDWRRLAAWLEGASVDAASIAAAAGISLAELQAGVASASPTRTTA